MALVLSAACDQCGAQAEWTAAVRHGNVDVDGEFCPACAAAR